ncbi:MAG: DUF3299 domain-containing protein [Bacteroidota bacterium]
MKENLRYIIWIAVLLSVVEVAFMFYKRDEFLRVEESFNSSSVNYWKIFAELSLKRQYVEEAGAHYRLPVFTPTIEDFSGKEIVLTGYFLPYSKIDSVIILSRYPNASCFFCGQAGIESVAMVELGEAGAFTMDQRLSVRGKLLLNASDVDRLAFILADARVEKVYD